MSNRAPDFTSTFKVVDDQLEETDRRLQERRRRVEKDQAKKESSNQSEKQPKTKSATVGEEPSPRSKSKSKKDEKPGSVFVKRAVRRNLTLKVLEENELQFNQLFHRLQIAGDNRRKQDLADEALALLFAKYKRLID